VIHGLVQLLLALLVVMALGLIGAHGFVAAREWRWNRDRRRRIRAMLERDTERDTERGGGSGDGDGVETEDGWADAMARQLEEIRGLPEFVKPRR
jgi:hypothetical protein